MQPRHNATATQCNRVASPRSDSQRGDSQRNTCEVPNGRLHSVADNADHAGAACSPIRGNCHTPSNS